MKPTLLRKSMVCGILGLFLTMSLPTTSGSLFLGTGVVPDILSGIGGFRDDTTPPITTLSLDPAVPDGHNDWYISNLTVFLNATDDSSGVNITYYKLNNGDWEIYDYPFVLTTSNYYVIQYYSIDFAGNVENTKSASCKVDVVPPVTHIIIDDQGWHISVSFWATDDMSGVDYICYQIDGGAWQTGWGGFYLTTDGTHIIKFYSVDKAGNVEDVQQVTIHPPDTSPPTIHLAVEKIFLNEWMFIVEACDANSGMDRVEFYVDNKMLGSLFGPGSVFELNWTCPDSKGHTVHAIAYDRAGNFAASDIITSFSESFCVHDPAFQDLMYFIQRFICCWYTIQSN